MCGRERPRLLSVECARWIGQSPSARIGAFPRGGPAAIAARRLAAPAGTRVGESLSDSYNERAANSGIALRAARRMRSSCICCSRSGSARKPCARCAEFVSEPITLFLEPAEEPRRAPVPRPPASTQRAPAEVRAAPAAPAAANPRPSPRLPTRAASTGHSKGKKSVAAPAGARSRGRTHRQACSPVRAAPGRRSPSGSDRSSTSSDGSRASTASNTTRRATPSITCRTAARS